MAKREDHCKDCERILGNRHEDVNRWMDELFGKHGPRHRRFRHCWKGVREAKELFGPQGARAAIVHIVRDCGGVPDQRTYDETALGIVLAPEFLAYDDLDEKAFDKFRKVVEADFEKAGKLGIL